jgi:DNA-binding SARP family transcriptional activator
LLRVAGLDVGVRAHQLAPADIRVVANLLEMAADVNAAGSPDEQCPVRVPVQPAPGPPASQADADSTDGPSPSALAGLLAEVDVLVRVLGDVEAVRFTPDGEVPVTATRQKAIEAIAYMALREGSVDREDVQAALWPAGTNAPKTFSNAVWAARKALNDGRGNGELLPDAADGRYWLSHRVVTDYGLFCELVERAENLDDALAAADLLTEALTLVRGEPFTGAGRNYAWVGPHRGMIVAQIVDHADELAEVRLSVGHWRQAEWAARQGLRAMPCDERLYRILMRTAHAAGNIPGVHRVFRELCDAVADPDTGVEPEDTLHAETIALYEELSSGRRAKRVTA